MDKVRKCKTLIPSYPFQMVKTEKCFYIAYALDGIPQELVYWYLNTSDAEEMAEYFEDIDTSSSEFEFGFTDYGELQYDLEHNVITLRMECSENDLKFKKIVQIESDVIPYRKPECLEFCGDFVSLEDATRAFGSLEIGLQKFFECTKAHMDSHGDDDDSE